MKRRSDRAARHEVVKALTASRRAETRYVSDLVAIMGRVHAGVLKVVEREHMPAPETRHDAASFVGLGSDLAKRLFAYVRPQAQEAFDRMAKAVRKKQDPALQARLEADLERRMIERFALRGIAKAGIPGLEGFIATARENNVRLVTRASADFLDQVRGVLEESDGVAPADLAEALRERVAVSKSRATLIARDQTLKLNGQIIEHRARAVGLARYVWSTSHDERVRPSHAELDGQTFSWDDPPETNEAGDTNHPGQDYQCRCVPIPVIDELEDDAGGAEPTDEAAE